ncbi:MAG: alpha/beta hydrolase, partial [Pseudomonadota bacterium]
MKTALVVLLGLFFVAVVVVQVLAGKRDRDAAANYPHTGQLIEVDGVTVHAVQTGQGPDVVLLHGASGNTRDFTFAFAD